MSEDTDLDLSTATTNHDSFLCVYVDLVLGFVTYFLYVILSKPSAFSFHHV